MPGLWAVWWRNARAAQAWSQMELVLSAVLMSCSLCVWNALPPGVVVSKEYCFQVSLCVTYSWQCSINLSLGFSDLPVWIFSWMNIYRLLSKLTGEPRRLPLLFSGFWEKIGLQRPSRAIICLCFFPHMSINFIWHYPYSLLSWGLYKWLWDFIHVHWKRHSLNLEK